MGNSKFWGPDWDSLENQDPEVAGLLLKELERARGGLQLIASENFTSPAVLAALGSTFSNKYAEGYPGKRYYGGCAVVDEAEIIGIERAKKLFEANIAVYGAFTKPGDTILAMSLAQGGHLTHGSPVSFSGKWFNPIGYSVDPKTELIDYDNVRDLAKQHKPKMIVAGATAYPRLVDFKVMREIADEVGAILWVDAAHFIGLVAGKAIPSPVPYADVVSFTTHKVLRGPRGGMILCKAQHAQTIDKAVFPMMQGGPLMHAVAAKAVALKECATPEYQTYAKKVVENAKALSEGLKAEGMRPVSGGTDTHLVLLDLTPIGVNGKDAEKRCDASRITLNKNPIPNDPLPPMTASGIRVGSPSVTTQGMGVSEMRQVASFIAQAVKSETGHDKIAEEVNKLCRAFPAYPQK